MSSNPTSATPAGTPAKAFPAAAAPSDSVPPVSALAELLRREAPHLFTEGRIDLGRLKAALGESAQQGSERYGLSWAGKGDCFRQIQQAWTGKTLLPCREESVNFDTTQNLFIEGENLQVLKLLQRVYHGKVKMIYIDPPYNTGNDSFVYPDRFKEGKDAYERRAGMRDAEGNWTGDVLFRKNTRENGHYHSNWLTMMYPRLFLARQLLRDDGVMFVSIDDNEVHNLRMIMDEIFGEENFVNTIAVKRRTKGLMSQFEEIKSLNQAFEYVLIYRKSTSWSYENPVTEAGDKRKEGYWNAFWNTADRPTMRYKIGSVEITKGQWKWSPERGLRAYNNYLHFLSLGYSDEQLRDYYMKNKDQYFERNGYDLEFVRTKGNNAQYWTTPSETVIMDTDWMSFYVNDDSGRRNYGFETAKHPDLIKKTIAVSGGEDGLIFDFFSGSGTTAQAVLELNRADGGTRRFICVQLPESAPDGSAARQAGYGTIAEIGKERIRRVINKMAEEAKGKLPDMARKSPEDLGFKVFKLAESGLREWECSNVSAEELARQLELFTDTVKPESAGEGLLYELILGGEGELTAPVERMAVEKGCWYRVDGGRLAICVEREITQALVEAMLAAKPQKLICLDIAFAGNDPLKKNMALQLEAAKIEFKTV